jgi:membrane protease YdiL (CAAX protease family)
MYPELRGFGAYARGAPLDIALGVASGLLWMAPFLVAPAAVGEALGRIELPLLGVPWPDTTEGFDATQAGARFATLALALRGFGYVMVTPLFEELFIRSFVMRFADVYDKRKDFRDVPIARYTARSFWLVTLFFTIGHVTWEYWVAVPWVMATSWWFYRRGHIGAVILLHAAANATILIAAWWANGPLWFFV